MLVEGKFDAARGAARCGEVGYHERTCKKDAVEVDS
jgi:hypothetical protein